MANLHVLLLGRFGIAADDGPFDLQPALARLVAYLALAGGRPVPGPRAAGAFWPDLPEQRARANLSTVAWRLRSVLAARGLPPDIVQSSGASLRLDPDRCEVDVEHVRRHALTPGGGPYSLETLSRAAGAVRLYRGDLLEDWDAEWCDLERESLRRTHMSTLRALAEAFERRGRLDQALRYARQAADVEPFDEAVQRALMRLLVLSGDRAAAVHQFNRFARRVRSELGTEPDDETLALAAEIKAGAGSRPLPRGPWVSSDLLVRPERAPFVGRLQQRETITALLDTAAAGTGGGLLLIGEAGTGKSRLVEWAMEEWAARGGSGARGRCVEFNEPVPYQPVLDALSAHVETRDMAEFITEHGQAFSELPIGPGGTDLSRGDEPRSSAWPAGTLRLFHRFCARLESVSRSRPLLMVIEDLQWADAGTVDILAYLLERARTMRLAVLLTSRPVQGRGRRTSGTERLSRYCAGTLRLDPMGEDVMVEFVRALLGGDQVPPHLARWLYAETEGNPLFVIETLRLLQQQGRLTPFEPGRLPDLEDGAHPGATPIPDGVRSIVRQRLALLEASPLRVAEIASVLGRAFDEDLLAMVSGIGHNRLSRAVADLLQAGIFEREQAGYRFSHDKIRAVCYENLPARVRRSVHVRAAAALAQMPEIPTQRLAWHRFCAGQWHLAAASWTTAGDRAREIHAHQEALRAYRHAVLCVRRDATRSAGERDLEEFRLLVKTDEVLATLGRQQERRLLLERMGALCRRARQAWIEAAWLLRRAFFEEHAANFTLAYQLARRAWCLARTDGDGKTEVEALRLVAWALNRSGRHGRSLTVSRLALRKAGHAPSAAKAAVLQEAAIVHIKLSDFTSAMSYLETARRTMIDLGYADENPHILSIEGVAHKWLGDLASSRLRLTRAMRAADQIGDVVSAARTTFQLATLDALEGQLGDALRKLRKAITASRSAGYARTYISCLNEIANGVGRLIGNHRWAWDASERALRLAHTGASKLLVAVCRDSQAQLLLDLGRPEAAMTAVGEVFQLLERGDGSIGPGQEHLTRRGAAQIALGHLKQAVADLELARQAQAQTGDRLVLVDTLTHLALAHAGLGESGRALAASEEALRLLEEIGYANYQPQRIFWHHYRILEMLDRTPRLEYLERAVGFITAQAATLSRAQARRLREAVCLNRDILEAWNRVRPPVHT